MSNTREKLKKQLKQSSMFFRSPTSLKPQPQHQLIEIKHVRDILKLKHITLGTWFISDLDNAAVETEDHHDELGSDQWFVQLLEYAKKVNPDSREAVSHVLTIYHAVQHQVSLKVVQPELIHIIQMLQDIGIPVLGLTARGSEIMQPTRKQLKRNGIDFSVQWPRYQIELDIGVTENPPVYKKGVIFCSGQPKEKCLEAFFELLGFCPEKIVTFDDKEKYLKAEIEMMKHHGRSAIGLRYGFLDEKVKQHDFEKAQRKLRVMSPDLPREAQKAMTALGLKM